MPASEAQGEAESVSVIQEAPGEMAALVPVEFVKLPEDLAGGKALDICALYLAGRGMETIARKLHVRPATVVRVIHESQTPEGMSVFTLRHRIEKGILSRAQYEAQIEGWRAMRQAAKERDYKGLQKAGYGAKQAHEAWLDTTEGRKGERKPVIKEETVRSSREVEWE